MAIEAGGSGFTWTEAAIKANAPNLSGVYAIYNDRWLYIGESNDLKRRLLEHFNGDNLRITRANPTGFTFELCDQFVRMRRQAQLIAQLVPVCNQQAG